LDLKRREPPVLSRHITIGPDSRRERVVLNLIVGGVDAVSARLKPEEAEDLITKLGHARASLKEPVGYEPDPRARLDFTVVDPVWRASNDPRVGPPDIAGVTLALRHSGYGWLSFLLPYEEARSLGRWLLDHAEAEGAKVDTAQAS
jgi:hypothetical protein